MTKQTALTKKVKNFMRTHHITQTESHILVGLSGGADSVCLLCALKELQEEEGLALSALHVHHGIRGEEADRDARFCEELCQMLGVPCRVVSVDVPAMAAEEKMSLEEAARRVRYGELEAQRQQIVQEQSGDLPGAGADCAKDSNAERQMLRRPQVYIAVAHHREDQAETVLWNLFRGSGLKGLGGMEPVNGAVIRPLLEVSKAEILEYLRQQSMEWQQDSTNDSDEYTRNRIRQHILGYAAEHINEGVAEHICQAARMAGQADEYLRRQAGKWLEQEMRWQQDPKEKEPSQQRQWVIVSRLVQEEEILQSYILRELLERCRGLTDVTARHMEAMKQLLTEVPGGSADRQMDLGEGWIVRRSYDRLWIQPTGTVPEVADESCWEVIEVDLESLEETVGEGRAGDPRPVVCGKEIRFGETIFSLRMFSYEKTQKIPTNQYTKWINYDKLGRTLVFRTRQIGDYILLPHGGRKTVKSYMIDEKIPVEERDRIPVIAQGSHVLWIAGHRLSEGAKVGEDTRTVLEIQMHGG